MRERGRVGCHHSEVTWDEMPTEDDPWTAGDADWNPATDWADATATTTDPPTT